MVATMAMRIERRRARRALLRAGMVKVVLWLSL
jgi:hypothetical protein